MEQPNWQTFLPLLFQALLYGKVLFERGPPGPKRVRCPTQEPHQGSSGAVTLQVRGPCLQEGCPSDAVPMVTLSTRAARLLTAGPLSYVNNGISGGESY